GDRGLPGLVLRRNRRGTAAAPVPDDAAGVADDAGRQAPAEAGAGVGRDRDRRHRIRPRPPADGFEDLGPRRLRGVPHRAAQRRRRLGVRLAVLEARHRDGDARPLQRGHRAARARAARGGAAGMSHGAPPSPARDPRLQLEPPSPRAFIVLAVLVVGLPLLGEIVGGPIGHNLPVGGVAGRLLGAAVMLAVAGAAYAVLALAMRRHHIALDAGGIEVATSFYRRRLAWDELRLDAA